MFLLFLHIYLILIDPFIDFEHLAELVYKCPRSKLWSLLLWCSFVNYVEHLKDANYFHFYWNMWWFLKTIRDLNCYSKLIWPQLDKSISLRRMIGMKLVMQFHCVVADEQRNFSIITRVLHLLCHFVIGEIRNPNIPIAA